jgi:hypothetical protein
LAFWASDFFPRRENDRLEMMLTLAAGVFEYRHESSLARNLKSKITTVRFNIC